jgi:hypothetical protein
MMRRNGFLFIPLLFFFFSTNITPEKWLSYITFLFSNVSQKIDSFVQKAYIHRIAPLLSHKEPEKIHSTFLSESATIPTFAEK